MSLVCLANMIATIFGPFNTLPNFVHYVVLSFELQGLLFEIPFHNFANTRMFLLNQVHFSWPSCIDIFNKKVVKWLIVKLHLWVWNCYVRMTAIVVAQSLNLQLFQRKCIWVDTRVVDSTTLVVRGVNGADDRDDECNTPIFHIIYKMKVLLLIKHKKSYKICFTCSYGGRQETRIVRRRVWDSTRVEPRRE